MTVTVRATAATELLVPSLRALEKRGPEVAQLASENALAILAADGLALASFQDLAVRIPHDTALRLLDDAVRVSGNPAFALEAGRGVERGDFGVFHLLTASAATLGESMHLAAHYLPLLHDGATIAIVEEGDVLRWEHSLIAGVDSTAAANEYVVASFFFGAQMTLSFVARPLEVRFMHPQPTHRRPYDDVFDAPVKFGAVRNTLVMPRAALDAPLATADRATLAVLTRYADELLARLPSVHPFVQRVRDWVRTELPRGASLEELARAMHMSQSSVQRRLARTGTSHSEILDGVRRQVATALLGETDLNINEIAFQLGFGHRPAFHRAFRRWYGRSPTEHREQHAHSTFYRFHQRGERGRTRS